jgi:hypothetical protein
MFIIELHSNRGTSDSQSTRPRPIACTVACLLLLASVGLGGSGCNSIYHRTRATLPPEPAAELGMRVADARRAESLAGQAGRKLQEHLNRGLSGEVIQADFDRLELAAFELERRGLAARDAQKRCGEPAALAGEIEQFHRRSNSWQDYVQANRHADLATQSRRLDALLRGPAAR